MQQISSSNFYLSNMNNNPYFVHSAMDNPTIMRTIYNKTNYNPYYQPSDIMIDHAQHQHQHQYQYAQHQYQYEQHQHQYQYDQHQYEKHQYGHHKQQGNTFHQIDSSNYATPSNYYSHSYIQDDNNDQNDAMSMLSNNQIQIDTLQHEQQSSLTPSLTSSLTSSLPSSLPSSLQHEPALQYEHEQHLSLPSLQHEALLHYEPSLQHAHESSLQDRHAQYKQYKQHTLSATHLPTPTSDEYNNQTHYFTSQSSHLYDHSDSNLNTVHHSDIPFDQNNPHNFIQPILNLKEPQLIPIKTKKRKYPKELNIVTRNLDSRSKTTKKTVMSSPTSQREKEDQENLVVVMVEVIDIEKNNPSKLPNTIIGPRKLGSREMIQVGVDEALKPFRKAPTQRNNTLASDSLKKVGEKVKLSTSDSVERGLFNVIRKKVEKEYDEEKMAAHYTHYTRPSLSTLNELLALDHKNDDTDCSQDKSHLLFSDTQEEKFKTGIRTFGRDFGCIQKEYLTELRVGDLVEKYYKEKFNLGRIYKVTKSVKIAQLKRRTACRNKTMESCCGVANQR